MGCSVLTAVAALCLAGHLSVFLGLAQGQRDAHWSPSAAVSTPSGAAAEARKPSSDSDGRRSASQPAATEGGDAALLAGGATTSASPSVVSASPEHLVFRSDGQEGAFTTPPEDSATTLTENSFTIPPEDIVTIYPEDNFTTSPEYSVTTPPEDSVTTIQESIPLTTQGTVTSTRRSGGDLRMTPALEDGRVPTRVLQLVICACPLPTPDDCQRFLSDLYIDGKDDQFLDAKKPVASLNVTVHNMTCEKEDHRFMTFSTGQFYLRDRGDVVLRNVGYLEGLRVNDYCVDPHEGTAGYYTEWTINVCVPPPSVPRCCPPGQALKDGKCEAANTPDKLEPPMSAGVNHPSIFWPIIRNHDHLVTCASDPLLSVPLLQDEESYLLAVPTGLVHIWHPSDHHILRKFTYPPDVCVDGYVGASGSVRYTANFCYTHPEELHRQVCDGHTCVRKCCKDNEEMSLSLYRCIPTNASTFKPHFRAPPDNYSIVTGLPLCLGQVLIDDHTLDSRGNLHFHSKDLTAREYCVDKFSNGLGEVFDKAKVCISEPTLWTKVRQIAHPLCQAISLLFLTLTVLCNILVPELLQSGGWYQLFHVLSLMLGYASMLAQELFSRDWPTTTCVAMGILLQFGFLATFFWLNVLCFEVWRKIRSLNQFRAASTVPMWAYLLYAFGVPAAIGVLTVCMQLYAPEGVPGVLKPNLAKSTCFFDVSDPLTHFLYFYGPIAFLFICNIAFITHTFWTYRKIEQNTAVLKMNSAENKTASKTTEHTQRKRNYVSDFKQQFSLLVLMSSCWVTEVLSWQIPPPELWSVTDLLNSLQGFFIFVIFIANRTKRKHLKRKFPLPFKMAKRLRKALHHCCCQGTESACLAPVSSFTSQISRKLSSSSVISNLSTLSTSLKFAGSSFSVTLSDDENLKKPSVLEPGCGVVGLSHSPLDCVSLHENGATQC